MAQTPQLAAAKRRLKTVLDDEEYGPKLVRLGRAEQRKILLLIEQNRGREARKEILAADERRLLKARVTRYAKRTRQERQDHRPVDQTRDFWALYDGEELAA